MVEVMARLRLTFFGGFAASDDTGAPIVLRRRKAKALLAYLALQQGRPQSRETIAGLLWGDRDQRHARMSLRQALAILRRSIPAPYLGAMQVSGEEILLRSDGVEVDAVAFRHAIDEGTVSALEHAVALYRGDLLDGFVLDEEAFDAWLANERDELRRMVLGALRRILHDRISHGAADQAEEIAVRLLALDPAQEDVQRRLMQIYAAQGRRDRALRQYEQCRAMLRSEFGVAPEPETERLHLLISQGGSQAPPRQLEAPDLAHRRHLAVLRFDAHEPDMVRFAVGLREELIAALSAWHTFATLDDAAPSADYALLGSVRRSGGRTRVIARLIEVGRKQHMWADRFDHAASETLAIQEALAQWIAASVAPEVEMAQSGSLTARDESLSAWHLCQRGMAAARRRTRSGVLEANQLFEQAVAKEPGYAQALSGLAGSFVRAASPGWMTPRGQIIAKALAAAERAVALDPSDASIRVTLGCALLHARAFERARAEILTALDLNPSNAFAYAHLGVTNECMGEAERGVENLRTAARLAPKRDPRASAVRTWLARAHLCVGLYDDAAERARREIERRPDYGESSVVLASSLYHLGEKVDVGAALADCERMNPGFIRHRAHYDFCRDARDEHHILAGVTAALR